MRKILLILVLVLIIAPGSAYTWWFDHFTSNNSASYGGDTGTISWANTGLTTGWLNYTFIIKPYHYSYKNEMFGGGYYSWYEYFDQDYPYLNGWHYAAQDIYSGEVYDQGTKYWLLTVYSAPSTYTFILRKVIAGSQTTIASAPGVTYPPGQLNNITIDWDGSNVHKIYLNDDLIIDTTDNAITSAGYMGVDAATTTNNANNIMSWDLWQYSNATSPVSAPVASFTCTPLSGCVPPNVDIICTDSSTNTPTLWAWNITNQTDNLGYTSSVQNPIFNLSAAGTYNVNLTSSNAGGSDLEEKIGYITITECGPTTPTPTLIPQRGLGYIPFVGPQINEPGILTSIYLVLDQQPFILIAVLILAFLILTSPRR